MVRVEVQISNGALRQPGMWGKFIAPNIGDIYDVRVDGGQVSVKENARKITLPEYPEGGLLLFGTRGFHGAGILSAFYILMRIQDGAVCDWQFPPDLARFQGKGVALAAQATEDLTPIYSAVRTAGFDPERLRTVLRQQGMDRQPHSDEATKR